MSQRTMSVAGYVENVLPYMFTLNRSKLGMKLVLANQHCVMMPRAANIVNGVELSEIINPDFFFALNNSHYEVIK